MGDKWFDVAGGDVRSRKLSENWKGLSGSPKSFIPVLISWSS